MLVLSEWWHENKEDHMIVGYATRDPAVWKCPKEAGSGSRFWVRVCRGPEDCL